MRNAESAQIVVRIIEGFGAARGECGWVSTGSWRLGGSGAQLVSRLRVSGACEERELMLTIGGGAGGIECVVRHSLHFESGILRLHPRSS